MEEPLREFLSRATSTNYAITITVLSCLCLLSAMVIILLLSIVITVSNDDNDDNDDRIATTISQTERIETILLCVLSLLLCVSLK